MVKENTRSADCGGDSLSVTTTSGLNPPWAVGVPLIVPVAALIVRPGGKPVADHV